MENINEIRFVEGNQDYLNEVKNLWEKQKLITGENPFILKISIQASPSKKGL